jgi:hypothetical protein
MARPHTSMDSRIPVVVRMQLECAHCGFTEDETYEFDIQLAKSYTMEAYEPGRCLECGARVHMPLTRTQQGL